MANTGFMIIKVNKQSEDMIEKWFGSIQQSNITIKNDQPPFQEVKTSIMSL
jgi:hypothetical protein